jgi:hypothetical protein
VSLALINYKEIGTKLTSIHVEAMARGRCIYESYHIFYLSNPYLHFVEFLTLGPPFLSLAELPV